MALELDFTEAELQRLQEIKGPNILLVPGELWALHVKDNPKVDISELEFIEPLTSFVMTERNWFTCCIEDAGYLFIENKRLVTMVGGVWFTVKLEPKKKFKKVDIFNGGHRVSGSFRSNG